MRVWSFVRVIAVIAGLALATAAAPASASASAAASAQPAPLALPTCKGLTTSYLPGGVYIQTPSTAQNSGDSKCKLTLWDNTWGVVALQQWIHYCGGPQVDIDGIYGPITEDAVEWTQAAHGLVVDGDYGPATRDVMPKALFTGNSQFVRCANR